jgi:hypothetical protein
MDQCVYVSIELPCQSCIQNGFECPAEAKVLQRHLTVRDRGQNESFIWDHGWNNSNRVLDRDRLESRHDHRATSSSVLPVEVGVRQSPPRNEIRTGTCLQYFFTQCPLRSWREFSVVRDSFHTCIVERFGTNIKSESVRSAALLWAYKEAGSLSYEAECVLRSRFLANARLAIDKNDFEGLVYGCYLAIRYSYQADSPFTEVQCHANGFFESLRCLSSTGVVDEGELLLLYLQGLDVVNVLLLTLKKQGLYGDGSLVTAAIGLAQQAEALGRASNLGQ